MPGNIGLGFTGFDWDDRGVGVCLFGVRVGVGGDKGLQLGVGASLGVQVNGSGLGANARAGIGIGGDEGFSVSAGAKAAAIDGQAGVGASASTNSGPQAAATATTPQTFSRLRGQVQSCQRDYESSRRQLEQAECKFAECDKKKKGLERHLAWAKERLRDLEQVRNGLAVKKTELESSWVQAHMDVQTATLTNRKTVREQRKSIAERAQTLGEGSTPRDEKALAIEKLKVQIDVLDGEAKQVAQAISHAQDAVIATKADLDLSDAELKEAAVQLEQSKALVQQRERAKQEADKAYRDATKNLSGEVQDKAVVEGLC